MFSIQRFRKSYSNPPFWWATWLSMPIFVSVSLTIVGCEQIASVKGDGFEIQAMSEQVNPGRSYVVIYKVNTYLHLSFKKELFYFTWEGILSDLKLITNNILDVNMGVRVIVPLHFDLGEARAIQDDYIQPDGSNLKKSVSGIDDVFVLKIYGDIGEIGSGVYRFILRKKREIYGTYSSFILGVRELNVQFIEQKVIQLDIAWLDESKNDTAYLYWEEIRLQEDLKISSELPPDGWDTRPKGQK